jgi:3-hydroxyacyl-CoA dehydrogenase
MYTGIVAVIGAGDMGHGIAECCALECSKVYLYDIKEQYLTKAMQKIGDSLVILARKRKIKENQIDEIKKRIFPTTDMRIAVEKATFIIEAVPEIPELKKSVYTTIEKYTPETTIITTNTSTISITELANSFKNPSRFMGIHFFNPVIMMKAVEVIFGKLTSPQTIDTVMEFANIIKKKPVKIQDSPGFVVNRVQASVQILLCNAVQQKIITPDQIDAEMKRIQMPMGAFEIMDFVGLDISFHVMEQLARYFGKEYAPPKWFSELVTSGNLGKKTGRGVYDWSSGKAEINLNAPPSEITVLDLMVVQINEATKILEQKIVSSPSDIDNLIINGTGNPMGIFGLLKSQGKKAIIERCEYFAAKLGMAVFKPTRFLLDWEENN